MQTEIFKELLEKYLDESIQPQERQQLASMLEDPACRAMLDEEVLLLLSSRTYAMEPDQQIKDSIQYKLEKEMLPAPLVSVQPHVRILRQWGWAAAVLAFVVGGWYLFTNIKRNDAPLAGKTGTVQPGVITPGGSKAILTLADGSLITLDSAVNGDIARQGNTSIVKLADGQVVYRPQGISVGEGGMNTLSTPRGGQYQLTLPDGSKVWLNAASSITYPAAFAGNERKVKITGEAYFEVVANKSKPFLVSVNGGSTVEVLGTHFNINSYIDENSVRTTLLEGRVRIRSGKNSVVLQPGQQSVVQAGREEVSVNSNLDIERLVAWKNGLFVFEDDDIKSIMRQVGRWYDVEIVYDNPPLSKLFMGKIPRDAPVSMVLELLETTGQVHFKIEGKKIIVHQ